MEKHNKVVVLDYNVGEVFIYRIKDKEFEGIEDFSEFIDDYLEKKGHRKKDCYWMSMEKIVITVPEGLKASIDYEEPGK